jgi:manganese transport protein
MRPWLKNAVLSTAVLAAVSTATAEILGGAIALNMLFHLPLKLGAMIVLAVALYLQFSNSYKKIEKITSAFVSVIGLSFYRGNQPGAHQLGRGAGSW